MEIQQPNTNEYPTYWIENNTIQYSQSSEQNKLYQKMIEQTPQRKHIILIPSKQLIANNSILMKVSTRIRSYGYIVECKKRIQDIKTFSSSTKIVYLQKRDEICGHIIEGISKEEIEKIINQLDNDNQIANGNTIIQFNNNKGLFSYLSTEKTNYHSSTSKFFTQFKILNCVNQQQRRVYHSTGLIAKISRKYHESHLQTSKQNPAK